MTREEVRQIMELEDDQDDKITMLLNRFQAEKSQVKANPEAQKKADELAEQVRESESKIKDLKRQLTDTRSNLRTAKEESIESENLLSQLKEKEALIEQLQHENTETKISNAINQVLAGAGVKNQKFANMITKSIDKNAIEIAEDGTVTGIEEQISAMKEDEDTAMLFRTVPKNTNQSYVPMQGERRDKESLAEQFRREREEEHKNVASTADPFLQALK